jgi:hypothetical protein
MSDLELHSLRELHLPEPVDVTVRPPLRRLGLVGQGDVVKHKVWPAIQHLSPALCAVAVVSREADSRLPAEPAHQYFPVTPSGCLPLAELAAAGFLTPETLWIIATPPEHHVGPAVQLARWCLVAVEKPAAPSAPELLPVLESPWAKRIYPIDHKLFNASPLALVDRCRQEPRRLRAVRRIEGVFYERSSFALGRQQDDTLPDVVSHQLNILAALLRGRRGHCHLAIRKGWVSQHSTDVERHYQPPKVPTAVRVVGDVVWASGSARFDLRQAKGAPRDEKWLRLLDGAGRVLHEMDLNESSWAAHARVLDALLQPRPDLRLSLQAAHAVLQALDQANGERVRLPSYPFGGLPDFPAFTQPSKLSRPRVPAWQRTGD